MMSQTKLTMLPLQEDVETKAVLRATARAHRFLAELKGAAASIPNQRILINSLGLQEAKDSSTVESIVTTHDELFQARLEEESLRVSIAAKEVSKYGEALTAGFQRVVETQLIRDSDIRKLTQILTGNGEYRKLPGTALKNDATGEVIYTPPQNPDDIVRLMDNLVKYINDESLSEIDPLVKMAIIHHQFETIHPFYDGNGRTGRIINILYLVLQGLLDIPVLYLSRFVVQNKNEYYRLLQSTRLSGRWEEWILFMLRGIAEIAQSTLETVKQIAKLMMETKHQIRAQLPKIYSQDLVNNLFQHPYTKIDFIMRDLELSRPTASKYLKLLVKNGFLKEQQVGRTKYFINEKLVLALSIVEERE